MAVESITINLSFNLLYKTLNKHKNNHPSLPRINSSRIQVRIYVLLKKKQKIQSIQRTNGHSAIKITKPKRSPLDQQNKPKIQS